MDDMAFLSFFLRQVREQLKKDVEQMKLKDPNFRPGLVVLQARLFSTDRNLSFLCPCY